LFDPRGFQALALMTVMSVTPALADPSGVWLEQDGGTIRIRPCGAAMCATIVSVNPPLDPDTGKPRTDKNNVDASKRNRPLVGVPVLLSMMPNGPGKWSGRLYDADRGQIFSGHLVEIGANSIRIEGCAMGICGGESLSRVSK
jgi:uncharacterized protein (DUF2147 family)